MSGGGEARAGKQPVASVQAAPAGMGRERLVKLLLAQDIVLEQSVAERLADSVENLRVPKNQSLFVENVTPADWLYFILIGSFNIIVGGRIVAILAAGKALGEFPLLLPQYSVHRVTAQAGTDTDVAKIRREEFARLARDAPSLWEGIAKSLATRLDAMNRPVLPDMVSILKAYQTNAHECAALHREECVVNDRRHLWLGIPTLCIATVVGSSVFASLASDKPGTLVVVSTGLLSILAAVLSALQTFLDFSKRAQAHKTAADSYSAIIRNIDLALGKLQQAQSETSAGELLSIVDKIGVQYADVDKASPNVRGRNKGTAPTDPALATRTVV